MESRHDALWDAVPAALILVSLSIPQQERLLTTTAGIFEYVRRSEPRAGVAQSAGRDKLTPEELAAILMDRKEYREAAFSTKGSTIESNHRSNWNKLGIALHSNRNCPAR